MSSLEKDIVVLREIDLDLLEKAKALVKTQVLGSSLVVSCAQRLTTHFNLWPAQRIALTSLLYPTEVAKSKKFNADDVSSYDDYKDSYD